MLASLGGARRDRLHAGEPPSPDGRSACHARVGFSRAPRRRWSRRSGRSRELMHRTAPARPQLLRRVHRAARHGAPSRSSSAPRRRRRGRRDIALQLLQTLAIVVQNIRAETNNVFLFSEEHAGGRPIEANLDFDDEEVLGRTTSRCSHHVHAAQRQDRADVLLHRHGDRGKPEAAACVDAARRRPALRRRRAARFLLTPASPWCARRRAPSARNCGGDGREDAPVPVLTQTVGEVRAAP